MDPPTALVVEQANVSVPVLGNVPAFLMKLWTLVEDPQTDALIRWSPTGASFHVFDQGRFSKEVLPKFFKHNNMASFIRQLNMYGFRKVVHLEAGGLVKPEQDDTEFQHQFFIRGNEQLLQNIKRKVTAVPPGRQVLSGHQDDIKASDEVTRILSDVQMMKGKQETIDSRITTLKQENAALWREVANLRQKHHQQQKVVTKMIQFLISLVQNNRIMGVKRKLPLMLDDGSSGHSLPKYSRGYSVQPGLSSGPIISDITDVDTPLQDDISECDPVETPLSPTSTFIHSILLDSANQSTVTSQAVPTENTNQSTVTTQAEAPPFLLMVPPDDQPQPIVQSPANQSTASVTGSQSPHKPIPAPSCQTVACIDKSELVEHVDSIDFSLENLQNVLNSQSFSFDTSPLLEFFSSQSPDYDLDSLDTLLSEPREVNSFPTGKQMVQYTPPSAQDQITSLEDVLEEELLG
ncbi:unnamed protein product [Knipowitschia caucasica]|uniref:HSF-type DNA-binding domain-containing protein n=1 Tax=Knipowitschia caucasica TaxID=637954 RepID=A0AAV2K787_KNICA